MAQASRPTPDNAYVVSTDEWERMGNFWAEDGIYGSPTDTAVVYGDSTGRQVKIRAGKFGIVRGYEWMSDPTTDEVVSSLPANVSGNPRIDRLVLRLDRSTRNVRTLYVQGTAAATPSAPALTQSTSFSSGVFDFPLARWQVASGYTTIAAGDVVTEAWYPLPSGVILCLSTGRPFGAGLRPGQQIYETDTGLTYRWRNTLNKFIRDIQHLVLGTQFQTTVTGMADTGFQFPAEANSTYLVDSWLHTVAPTAGDLALQWSLPSGTSIEWSLEGPASTDSAGAVTTVYQGAITTTGPLTIGGEASQGIVGTLRATIATGANGGLCKVQGAEGAASGTAFIRAASWMSVKQSG
jgi:hypothetical protein